MKKCWSKDPEMRPHYDKIIDGLNGEEWLSNDTPVTSEQHGAILQPEYQNFTPLAENG